MLAGNEPRRVQRTVWERTEGGSTQGPAPAPSTSPSSTRIRRSTATSVAGLVIRREIGKVPAPYTPVRKGSTSAAPVKSPPRSPAWSLEDFAALASRDYERYIGNDDLMLDLLLGPFEANWFKAKACLTMDQWPPTCTTKPDHDVGVKLMHALVRMRKAKWTEFVTTVVQPQFRERMAMFGAIQGPLTDLPKMPPPRKRGDATPPPDRQPGEPSRGRIEGAGVNLQSDLAAQAVRDAEPEEAERKKGTNLQDIFDSVGAEAVTSDVDLASGGSNSELGVQFVNSRFRTHFKPGRVIPYDPGTVFDINLYASDWIHGEAGSERTAVEGGDKVTITPRVEVPEMSATDTVKRDRQMEVWSLVKVRRNLTKAEWKTYTDKITGSLQGDELAPMQAKLADADKEYQDFKGAVEARQKKMMASIDSPGTGVLREPAERVRRRERSFRRGCLCDQGVQRDLRGAPPDGEGAPPADPRAAGRGDEERRRDQQARRAARQQDRRGPDLRQRGLRDRGSRPAHRSQAGRSEEGPEAQGQGGRLRTAAPSSTCNR